MSELTKRILSALIAAPGFLFLTWLGGWYFIATLIGVTMVVQLESSCMLQKKHLEAHKVMALLLGIPVLLMPVFPSISWPVFVILLIVVWISDTFRNSGHYGKCLMPTIMVGVTIPALFSGLLILRNFGTDGTGFALTLTLLFMVWANDILAFAGGKSMGKHPLAPSISPSKTVEGFLWGFLGCFLILGISLYLMPDYPLNLMWSIPFAILVGILGPAGDLAESKLKRGCEIKDSSGLMPGHGGLYDRFDAVLFAAPAVAVYVHILHYFNAL